MEAGIAQHAVLVYPGVHAARGDIVHVAVAHAHADQRVHVRRSSLGDDRHDADGVDAAFAEARHARMLDDALLEKHLAIVEQTLAEGCGVLGRAATLQTLDALAAEVVGRLCEDGRVALHKGGHLLRARRAHVKPVSPHVAVEGLQEGDLVLEGVVEAAVAQHAGQRDVVAHRHEGAAQGLGLVGEVVLEVLLIADAVREDAARHVDEDGGNRTTRSLARLAREIDHAPDTARLHARHKLPSLARDVHGSLLR